MKNSNNFRPHAILSLICFFLFTASLMQAQSSSASTSYYKIKRVWTKGQQAVSEKYDVAWRYKVTEKEGETVDQETCEGNCRNGIGKAYFSHDGSILYYDGEWKNGDKDGQGMLYYPSGGPRYHGGFLADLESGEGKQYQDNSGMMIYEGEWKYGMRHGQGIMHYPNGDKYVGTFSVGKKNGDGLYTFKDGTELAGVWKNNILIGKGALKKGEKEIAEHAPHTELIQTRCHSPYDCKNGYGIFTYDDGRRYEGNYKDSKFNGHGKFYNAQGVLIYEGNWENHQRSGQGIAYRDSDGSKMYDGTFAYNKRNGYGTIYHGTNGAALYTGDWLAGDYHGNGKLTDRNGKLIYNGPWKNGGMINDLPKLRPGERRTVVLTN